MKSLGCARISLLVLSAVVVLSNLGCAREEEPGPNKVAVSRLNWIPKASDFVVEAQNSVRLQTGSIVSGGDVGARGTTGGPFLSGGVAIDVLTGAKVEPSHSLIADSIRLGTGVAVGDVQTNRLVSGTGATHGAVSGLVALPAIPSASPVLSGTRDLAVATGASVQATPGHFATVSIGTGGKLRLAAGTYDMSDLRLGTGARIEALGPVQLRIANRLSTSSGAFIGAASGVSMTARDVRIEVSGRNGTSGALGATPAAASIGTASKVTALVLVPNGTLVLSTGVIATGAFMALDVDAGGVGTKLVFQDGFAVCTAATCDDGNPCTLDTCGNDGVCTHGAAPAGAACGDGNMCNGVETCDGQGTCQSGTSVVCVATVCHDLGTCEPSTGICSHPESPNGTQCSDRNACTQTDTCQAGVCVGSNACTPGCVSSPSGLVAFWTGDDDAADLVSGVGAGLEGDVGFAPGIVGDGFEFDGIDDAISAGNPAALRFGSRDFSVSAWVRFASLSNPPTQGVGPCGPGCDMPIVNKMVEGSNPDGWRLLKQADNHFWFCLGDGSNGCIDGAPTTLRSSAEAVAGVWYHVAAEKGPAGLTLFVDGIEVDHKPLPAFVDNDTADLRIGHYPLGPGSSSRMYGTIDEVQVFGRQLAVAEIQSLFNAGSHGVCRSGSCASCQPEVIYVANNTGGTISVIRDPL